MSKKLYVGNLAYSVRDQDLHEQFSAFGEVASVKVMTDRETGQSKGFAFIEMQTEQAASTAIREMDGTNLAGRNLTVNLARPMEPRAPGSQGPRGGFGGGNRRSY